MLGISLDFPDLLKCDNFVALLFFVVEVLFKVGEILLERIDISLLGGHVVSLFGEFL